MDIVVITPTYNERDNLPILVRRILSDTPYRILVVDDDSPDGTGRIAEELSRQHAGRVAVLRRTGTRGLGLSYGDGYRRALEEGADLICQMDADLSHDPSYLPELVNAALAQSDVVVGSRYLNGISVVNWPLRRIALSLFANWYVRTITGLNVRDSTSGYRCWRREALARLDLDHILSQGYAFAVETMFEAARRGSRIDEVPIIFVERRKGASKMSVRVLLESMIMPWRLLIRAGGRIGRGRPPG